MDWIYLILAGICEIAWAAGLKHTNNFQLNLATFIVIITMALSVVFLNLATRTIPISIAYAAWCSFGIIGVYLYGILFLKENFNLMNFFFICLIIIGVIGLKLNNR